MAIRINPYVAGNPVGDSPAFIGRADVLREVLHVLRRPQDNAIVLYGQRRTGKTSILQHLAAQLPKEGPYRPVYFDLQDKAAWPLGRVLTDLARAIAYALGQPDPDLGADPETAFRQTWLPVVLINLPEGCSLVLLLDEFDVLADAKAEQAAAAFFPYLRGLMASDPQRLKFAFAIGRNVSDLTNIALSLFKGIPSQRVTLLNQEDAAALVRLSQKNGTLNWPDDAMEQVWQLTHGHPFLTQQLCSHVWERAYDQGPDKVPMVTPADVDAAVPDALAASRSTLEWLWDGLPPAERVVISALADAGSGCITQEDLDRILRESGVRVVIRELQNAPQLLQDWDLIEPANDGYCFRVELLRQWIARHEPLRHVQDELDRIEPVAEYLYQAAMGSYRSGQLDRAVGFLQQAISLNPNHVGVNQLLADILLAQGQPGNARQLLEQLYEYQPAAAHPRLVQALLALAQVTENDAEQLRERTNRFPKILRSIRAWATEPLIRSLLERSAGFYERALELDSTQPEAIAKVVAVQLRKLKTLEKEKRYQDALSLARELADKYPRESEKLDLERLERNARLADLYQRGLGALKSGDRQTAQTLLARVIAIDPPYEEATRYLHEAVTGVDMISSLRAATIAGCFLLLLLLGIGSWLIYRQQMSFQDERAKVTVWMLQTATAIAQEQANATAVVAEGWATATVAVAKEQAAATVAVAQERATATAAAQATATANAQINTTATAVARQFGTCTEKDMRFEWTIVTQSLGDLWWPQDSRVVPTTWVAITNTAPYTGGKYCYLYEAALVTKELTPVAKLSQLQVIPVDSTKVQVPFGLPGSPREGQMVLTRTLYLQTYAPRLDGSMGNVLIGDPFTVSWSGNVVYNRDRDGIRDSEDCCPNDYGASEMRGCPDEDSDGFVDAKPECPGLAGDWCPWVYGKYGGCPAPSPTPTQTNR